MLCRAFRPDPDPDPRIIRSTDHFPLCQRCLRIRIHLQVIVARDMEAVFYAEYEYFGLSARALYPLAHPLNLFTQ